jgi:hypothetical protein
LDLSAAILASSQPIGRRARHGFPAKGNRHEQFSSAADLQIRDYSNTIGTIEKGHG